MTSAAAAARLLCGVLEGRPALRGCVFDLPSARAAAEALFAARGLADRARFVAGSFFEPAPPRADLYRVKSVIHDWDDARSVTILRRCREALHAGASAPPPGAAAGTPMEWFLTFSDLNMLINTGGRERTAAEYRALLGAAGLRVTAQREAGGYYSVIEAARGRPAGGGARDPRRRRLRADPEDPRGMRAPAPAA